MKLKDLAIEHQYYCSDNNYYDSDAGKTWETMSEFLDEFEDADIDMNLVFRWDVHAPDEDNKNYKAEVFIMHQRKGIFSPHIIKSFEEKEVKRFVLFLKKHHKRLKEIWMPFA
jgi:hypothetical protein